MSELNTSLPESYFPPRGDGSMIVGFSWQDELSTDTNGLYYREREAGPAHVQAWVERAWKTPHFSAESAGRLGGKLQEETVEFIDAYEQYRAEKTDERRTHFLDEAGDLAWVWIANASNVGLVLDTVLAQQAMALAGERNVTGSARNVQDFWRGEYTVPADRLLGPYGQGGFAENAEGVPTAPTTRLMCNAILMRAGARTIWLRDDGTAPRAHEVIAYGSAYLGPLIADSMLQLGALVRSEGGDMDEVLQMLQIKNEQRVAENAIDKDDPGRTS